ncbi:uncharacterized protein LOC125236276 [Leguminivora glycinivorella]|uniref:uncharacterized protein LOC125236276 n=1 Tax=Leguminivora glycinivorella TaxID=1035111 RepID=UPI002010BC50|nr:uncharacterized protein LOC125236276 [Leguminivora glycinivorella]
MRACGVILVFLCACVWRTYAEECIYGAFGECLSPCPPGTFSYTPGCGYDTMSRRTCRAPVARVIGRYCDYSRCDCDATRVWDEAARKCVLLKDCSDQTQFSKKNELNKESGDE